MNTAIAGFALVIRVLQLVFLGLAVVCLVLCVLDWLVRTRRINPFSAVARFTRRTIDPLLAPIERRVLRAGGVPSNAPWWALAAVVIGGILVLSLVQFVGGWAIGLAGALQSGPRGMLVFLVGAAFGVLQLAIMVRVLASWIPTLSPYSPWVRWAYVLSEPILAPLRRIVPPIGGSIDITPILAYFLIGYLLQPFVMGLLR